AARSKILQTRAVYRCRRSAAGNYLRFRIAGSGCDFSQGCILRPPAPAHGLYASAPPRIIGKGPEDAISRPSENSFAEPCQVFGECRNAQENGLTGEPSIAASALPRSLPSAWR